MIRKSILIIFVLILAAALALAVTEKGKDETVKCPVSGKEIKKAEAKSSTEYKGKTYYFCCDGCKAAFLKDPEKYAKKMEHAEHDHDGKVVDPVCNMEFKKEKAKATYEYDGKTYYFCNAKCKDKFVKNPTKYIRADDKVVTCPVSGEAFKKSEMTESTEYNGKTYYFCCPGCKEKFEKDPEKYTKEKK